MNSEKQWLRIDNLHCRTTKCQNNKDGFSFLPSNNPDADTPEVYCGCCGSRVTAEFTESPE